MPALMPAPAPAPEPVPLVLADISGYTRFLTANAKSLAHSQTILTELIQTLVHHAELPLEVAKLEGDAVFFVARCPPRAPGDAGAAAEWAAGCWGSSTPSAPHCACWPERRPAPAAPFRP